MNLIFFKNFLNWMRRLNVRIEALIYRPLFRRIVTWKRLCFIAPTHDNVKIFSETI